MSEITVRPIGHVRSTRSAAEDDDWDAVGASIVLDPAAVDDDATLGLGTFSHIEVVYVFHLVDEAKACRGARHPRGRDDWPLTGILAQRAKDRPNRIGVTTCRLDAVDGRTLRVTGLDAIDGTPVLDIKPAMSGFAPRGELREPDWALELMDGYW
ncbi:MAG TPA: SAM-dependent methyltransferase [Acidimicrobiales bacterium]|nr:SAM-dependent methyltransferase [Acidimicrobiales bacterium]